MDNIKYMVYSIELIEHTYIKKLLSDSSVECISAVDARSAVYIATGICAQNKCPVLVCVDSCNTSRSAYSGMTEAYYRHLPVTLVTFGEKLDYSIELNDVIFGHYKINNEDKIDSLLSKDLPIHIEVVKSDFRIKKYECIKLLNILKECISKDSYLYIGQSIKKSAVKFECKVVNGGLPDCYDGGLANVLGASLANIRKKYIGVFSEEELLHDINTLGNVNVSNSLLYIVKCDKENKILLNIAKSFLYNVESFDEDELTLEKIKTVLKCNIKTVLFVYTEK